MLRREAAGEDVAHQMAPGVLLPCGPVQPVVCAEENGVVTVGRDVLRGTAGAFGPRQADRSPQRPPPTPAAGRGPSLGWRANAPEPCRAPSFRVRSVGTSASTDPRSSLIALRRGLPARARDLLTQSMPTALWSVFVTRSEAAHSILLRCQIQSVARPAPTAAPQGRCRSSAGTQAAACACAPSDAFQSPQHFFSQIVRETASSLPRALTALGRQRYSPSEPLCRAHPLRPGAQPRQASTIPGPRRDLGKA